MNEGEPDPDNQTPSAGIGGGPGTASAPGERRLERPPSDRYRASASIADAPPAESAARGVALGSIAALVGAAAIVVLGGVLAISAGLLVVAVALGYAVVVGIRAGAGSTLADASRRWIAMALAATATILGFVGLWLFARAEGGVLALPDYLGEVFGPIVPLHLVLAVGAAWWTAR